MVVKPALYLDYGSAGAEDHDVLIYFGDDGNNTAVQFGWNDGAGALWTNASIDFPTGKKIGMATDDDTDGNIQFANSGLSIQSGTGGDNIAVDIMANASGADGEIRLGDTGTANEYTKVDSIGRLYIPSGYYLYDSSGADSVTFSHDGTDLNIAGDAGTGELNLTGFSAIDQTGNLFLRGEATALYLDYGSAGAEDHDVTIYFGDDGDNTARYFKWNDGSGTFEMNGHLDLSNGAIVGESANGTTPYIYFHTGTMGIVNGTGAANITIDIGANASGADGEIRLGDTGTAGEYVVIDSLGYMAIGATTTGAVLTVDGDKTANNLFEAINDDDGAVGDSSVVITPIGGVTLSDSLSFNTITAVIETDSVLTFYGGAITPANSFVEFVTSDGHGRFVLGRTTATEASGLTITDGEGEDPGYIELYDDAGGGNFIFMTTANELRGATSLYGADEDAHGYVIMDFDDGTIGGSAQDVLANDITGAGEIVSTPGGDDTVSDAGTIDVTGHRYLRVVGGDAEATNVSIEDGTADGQELFIQGTSDANLVTITDGNNCQLAGGVNFSLGKGDIIHLIWDSGDSDWYEISRSDN